MDSCACAPYDGGRSGEAVTSLSHICAANSTLGISAIGAVDESIRTVLADAGRLLGCT